MNIILSKFKSRILKLFGSELSDFRFLIGQMGIFTSRANYEKFKKLWDAEVKVYSQWGEDGIIDYLCERLEISKPKFLEIGAGNFNECNSRFLAEMRNASIFAVDGRNDLAYSIESNSLRWKNHIFAYQIWVNPENINDIISMAQNLIGRIDIFSLDLDGNDFWILEAAKLDSVSIVIVEYNPLFGHSKAVTVIRDDTFVRTSKHYSWLYYGASLKAFINLLDNKDFVFVGTNRVGNNAFFVRKSLRSLVLLEISADLSEYTDWRIREGRSQAGELSFASSYDRVIEIRDLPLLDLETGLQISVEMANPGN